MDEQAEQITSLYFRCGRCRLVGPSENLSYTEVPGHRGQIDFSRRPAEARCSICSTVNDVAEDGVAPLETEVTCPKCAAQVLCPAEAARVQCVPGCGLYFFGPGAADAAARQEVRDHEGAARAQMYSRRPSARG